MPRSSSDLLEAVARCDQIVTRKRLNPRCNRCFCPSRPLWTIFGAWSSMIDFCTVCMGGTSLPSRPRPVLRSPRPSELDTAEQQITRARAEAHAAVDEINRLSSGDPVTLYQLWLARFRAMAARVAIGDGVS